MAKRKKRFSLIIGYTQATLSVSLWHPKNGLVTRTEELLSPSHLPKTVTDHPTYDPLDIIYLLRSQIHKVFSKEDLTSDQILDIGLVSEPGTGLIWDPATGNPLSPILDRQDPKAIPLAKRFFFQKMGPTLHQQSGQLLRADLSIFHWKTHLMNAELLQQKHQKGALRFGSIATWILSYITGGERFIIDPSLASFTGLYNPSQNQWDPFLLKEFDIQASMLPKIQAPQSDFGTTKNFLPLADGLPITVMASTDLARLHGSGTHQPGDSLLNLCPNGNFSLHLLDNTTPTPSSTYPFFPKDACAWYDLPFPKLPKHWLQNPQLSLKEHDISAPNDQGLFIIPSTPKHPWDTVSLSLIGYREGISDTTMIRAYFESVVFQLKGFLSAVHDNYPKQLKTLYVDGAWCDNQSLLQLLADILQLPVTQTHEWPSEWAGIFRLMTNHTPAAKPTAKSIYRHTAPMMDPISCYALTNQWESYQKHLTE